MSSEKNKYDKNTVSDIVIGVPVRNEEKTIFENLCSIRKAVLFTKRDMLIVICINGCIDNTKIYVQKFIKTYPDMKCLIIESEEGLVNAQRAIVTFFPAKIYIFVDADMLIKENSIKFLIDELEKNPETILDYAKTVPLKHDDPLSIPYRLSLLYNSQKYLTKRYYFHGRLFATKDWFIPSNEEIIHRASQSYLGRLLLNKYSKNGILFNAVDVYMSAYLIKKYGLNSIKQISEAECYPWLINTWKDWWLNYRRIRIEVRKVKIWFHEFKNIRPYLYRYTNWKKWVRTSFSDRFLWLIYIFMCSIFEIAIYLEFLMSMMNIYEPKDQWEITATTKKQLPKINIFL